jgi:hypothetical protein
MNPFPVGHSKGYPNASAHPWKQRCLQKSLPESDKVKHIYSSRHSLHLTQPTMHPSYSHHMVPTVATYPTLGYSLKCSLHPTQSPMQPNYSHVMRPTASAYLPPGHYVKNSLPLGQTIKTSRHSEASPFANTDRTALHIK